MIGVITQKNHSHTLIVPIAKVSDEFIAKLLLVAGGTTTMQANGQWKGPVGVVGEVVNLVTVYSDDSTNLEVHALMMQEAERLLESGEAEVALVVNGILNLLRK